MGASTPIALTIAGSDSGGGAGVQADLKAFSANGVYGASVLTAITAQNTQAVTAVHAVPVDVVAAQIDSVLSDLDVDAVKLGMLFSPDLIATVMAGLADFRGALVADPVMIAKSGDALLQDAAVSALIADVLPRADVLTPNLPEAARLLGQAMATDEDTVAAQGGALLALGPKAVLMKGGHADGPFCTDLLVDATGVVARFEAPRIDTQNTHGTGCTYASSIAAHLARGATLTDAVGAAHTYLHAAIRAADDIEIGRGHGPVHHFHGMWA